MDHRHQMQKHFQERRKQNPWDIWRFKMYKRKGDQQPHETCKKLYGQSRENSTKKKKTRRKQKKERQRGKKEKRRRKETTTHAVKCLITFTNSLVEYGYVSLPLSVSARKSLKAPVNISSNVCGSVGEYCRSNNISEA